LSDYVGVVLAGGRGRRMGAVGEEYPKALLPVANRPLVLHHLQLLRDLGVREVFIVVGYRGSDVMEILGSGEAFGLTLRYAEQTEPLGSAHALGQLRPHVQQPLVVILGDYYLSAVDPNRLVRHLAERRSAIAARREPEQRLLSEACELRLDEGGRVTGIVEKPTRPTGDLKGCGFYALQPEVFDAVARTPRTALRDEYELTVALELFVASGQPLYAEEVIEWDQNLTNPEDVLECNLQWLAHHDRNELIDESAEVGPDAKLERTVVGPRARIENGAVLSEVVVCDDSTVSATDSVRRALVTRGGVHLLPSEPTAASPSKGASP
jgi:glucose-1-phosphate thymidylyltransferase